MSAAAVDATRAAVCAAAHAVAATGLSRGTSGNVSGRVPGGQAFLISPTGASLRDLSPGELVLVDLAGTVVTGRGPSSEWRMHRDVYRERPDVGGIVHAHPPFSTTLATLRRDLPAVHYELAVAGGHDVRCAGYATFGTEELSRHALAALEGRRACLLANHGLLAIGPSPAEALRVAETVEGVAELWWRASAVGAPVVLPEDEMALVVEKFRTYGRR